MQLGVTPRMIRREQEAVTYLMEQDLHRHSPDNDEPAIGVIYYPFPPSDERISHKLGKGKDDVVWLVIVVRSMNHLLQHFCPISRLPLDRLPVNNFEGYADLCRQGIGTPASGHKSFLREHCENLDKKLMEGIAMSASEVGKDVVIDGTDACVPLLDMIIP